MDAGGVYAQVSALLADYLEPLGMEAASGPLRVLRELTHGILFTQSVQLSNAARLWATDAGELLGAVQRMSAHLSDRTWDHREWAAAILAQQAQAVQADDLIALDSTELAKPYARHMEHVCTIRDASRPGDPLVNGYWCWGAYHWNPRHRTLAPLMVRPYSSTAPDFRSENDLICRWMWTLREALGGRGIWLVDRGADRPEILSALRFQPRWIVRLREDRRLVGPDGTARPAGVWADHALATRPERGHAVTLPVHLPPEDVRLYGTAMPLWLLVPTYSFLREGRRDRWVLLTRGLIDHHTGPRQTRRYYGLRWRAEDAKRLLGQLWHVERFQTRSWLALERMLWCVTLAGGFMAVLQRREPALSRCLQQEVLYHDKPYKLPGYRLARGLQALACRALDRVSMLQNA
jgi:hypothetical protein